MNVNELLAGLPADVALEFSGLASQVEFNPAARWISRILVRELARRKGEPQAPIPALELDATELPFALEWLEHSANTYCDAGCDREMFGLVLIGALLAHVRSVLVLRSQAATH